MDELNEYSYIWGGDKDKYVLVCDELGCSIFCINENNLMFLLIENEELFALIIAKMLKSGNKMYKSDAELKNAMKDK